ncbi:M48 family metallopeptidase [Flavobacterium tibetense]|uniref:Peptidase M48 n=1 Tax=Flavobacterium tibetense TaxID=2233533 RepID=A0A365P5F4_9FLAO|nr:M48 family metallopeptidase [Flavobacterium tibetense]RBA29841.1 peptidase M48 [Flavobacterium tibetense]
MKALSKGLLIIVLFFGLWILLAQIDFVRIFKIENVKSKTESSIGDLIWKQIEATEDVIYDEDIVSKLDSLLAPLCKENFIERDSLKVHIIDKDEVNAFAMPDNHLVVYTGLILKCKNEQALLGVLGHEIAHLQKNHVMKKLSKEIGFSVLMSMTGANATMIKEVLHTLSSSAYDRNLEREADMESVNYMINANIDPRPFADFMYELSLNNEIHKYTYWISTHPESEDRAKYILNYLKGKKIKNTTILSKESWLEFKQKIKDSN